MVTQVGSDMLWSLVMVTAVLGLLMGSAINAIVWRLKVGRSWVRGRSVCPDCGHTLAARDLVPVASWLSLRGKCRYCGHRIHWQYPVVELLTAALFGWSAYVLAPVDAAARVRLMVWLAVLVLLLILAVYDLRWMILPDRVMIPLIGVALAFAAVQGLTAHRPQVLLGPLLAAVLGGGLFLGIVVVSRGRAMGGGDIKLAFAMGLLLGLKGLAVAMLVAFNAAAVVGVVLMLLRRRRGRDQIPFGPFLVAGTVVAFWYAQPLVAWYLRLNGLS